MKNQIQNNWQKTKLGDVAKITKLAGYEFTKFFNSYKDSGEIIVLRGLNIKNGDLDLTNIKTIPKSISNQLTRSKLNQDDLVFSYVGTIGPIALITENNKYHLGPNICKITPAKTIFPKYLFQYFCSPLIKNEIEKKISIGAQPSLSMEKIRTFEILLPQNFEKQIKVTEILSSVDEAIEKTDQIIQKNEVLKLGLIQKLITNAVKSNKSFSGKLLDISEINPKIEMPLEDNLKVGFITMADVSNDAVITNIQEKNLWEVKKGFTRFQKNDVLFAKITPCMENGKGGICIDERYSVYFGSTEFHILRATSKVLPKYLHYFVNNSLFRSGAVNHMTGSAGQKRVSTDFLKNYPISLPDKEVQVKIVHVLQSIDSKLDTEKHTKNKLIEIKKGLMQDIFSQKVQIN